MFCPKCQSEYSGGQSECPECNIGLVDGLPPEDRLNNARFVHLMTASDGIGANLAKSVLEEHGICCSITENLNDFLPGAFAGTLAAKPLSCPVAIQVLSSELEEARRLLKTVGGFEFEE